MNIDHQIAMLKGADPLKSMDVLRQLTPEQCRPAVQALISLFDSPNPTIAINALQLAFDSGPDSESDFTAMAKQMLKNPQGGYMTPRLVTLLEQFGPQYSNSVELIAEFLSYPHYRPRLAAMHALATMTELFELIEPQLLTADNDICQSVRLALATALSQTTPQQSLSQTEINQQDELERLIWFPRAHALNSNGEDGDDVVFFFLPLTDDQQKQNFDQLINDLAKGHDLQDLSTAIKPMEPAGLETKLKSLLTPLYPDAHPAPVNAKIIANLLLALFDHNVQLFTDNGTQITGSGVLEGGLILRDQTRIALFWVSDMD